VVSCVWLVKGSCNEFEVWDTQVLAASCDGGDNLVSSFENILLRLSACVQLHAELKPQDAVMKGTVKFPPNNSRQSGIASIAVDIKACLAGMCCTNMQERDMSFYSACMPVLHYAAAGSTVFLLAHIQMHSPAPLMQQFVAQSVSPKNAPSLP
jgi:hypothetical protein